LKEKERREAAFASKEEECQHLLKEKERREAAFASKEEECQHLLKEKERREVHSLRYYVDIIIYAVTSGLSDTGLSENLIYLTNSVVNTHHQNFTQLYMIYSVCSQFWNFLSIHSTTQIHHPILGCICK
jgi:hypothetical protein